MKTINVTDATFEEFKKAKLEFQVMRNEEMSDSTALSEMLKEFFPKACISSVQSDKEVK